MYRYRFLWYLVLLILISSLCGCEIILEREFISEEVHLSADDEEEDNAGVLELTSYHELKAALLSFIENHLFVQTVRLTDYSGDVERDVQNVVRDVMATPLGNFAVTNVAYQSSRILSYYEIRFDISYRRTAQEIEMIEQVEDIDELERFLRGKMTQFSTSILFELEDYTPSNYDIPSIFMRIYYDDPRLAYGFQSLTTHYYPERGSARIVELTVTYAQQPTTLAAKSATAVDEAQIILNSYVGSNLTANRLRYFYNTICTTVEFDDETAQAVQTSESLLPKGDPFTVYGALIKKEAVSEGMALAFKQLCDLAEIDCVVVSGRLDGAPHMWNLVRSRGEWSHVDCCADVVDGVDINYAFFGRTDEEMSARYTWDREAYPASNSDALREMLELDHAG